MAIDVVVLDCSGVIFLWLLGSLEIFPAPLPATLPGHPGHEYDPASASKFVPTSRISRRKTSTQGLFPALFAPIFETSLSDLLDIRSFFSFHFALCTWVHYCDRSAEAILRTTRTFAFLFNHPILRRSLKGS